MTLTLWSREPVSNRLPFMYKHILVTVLWYCEQRAIIVLVNASQIRTSLPPEVTKRLVRVENYLSASARKGIKLSLAVVSKLSFLKFRLKTAIFSWDLQLGSLDWKFYLVLLLYYNSSSRTTSVFSQMHTFTWEDKFMNWSKTLPAVMKTLPEGINKALSTGEPCSNEQTTFWSRTSYILIKPSYPPDRIKLGFTGDTQPARM